MREQVLKSVVAVFTKNNSQFLQRVKVNSQTKSDLSDLYVRKNRTQVSAICRQSPPQKNNAVYVSGTKVCMVGVFLFNTRTCTPPLLESKLFATYGNFTLKQPLQENEKALTNRAEDDLPACAVECDQILRFLRARTPTPSGIFRREISCSDRYFRLFCEKKKRRNHARVWELV